MAQARMAVVLRVELLQVDAGHELLRRDASTDVLLLLLLLWMLLLLLLLMLLRVVDLLWVRMLLLLHLLLVLLVQVMVLLLLVVMEQLLLLWVVRVLRLGGLLLWLLLWWRRLPLAVVHHTARRCHLVVTHGGSAVHLASHGPHQSRPLAHGGFHVGLGPPAVVLHHLPVGQLPEAGLGPAVLLGLLLETGRLEAAVHAHAVPVHGSVGSAVGHGHHHVLRHTSFSLCCARQG